MLIPSADDVTFKLIAAVIPATVETDVCGAPMHDAVAAVTVVVVVAVFVVEILVGTK